MAFDPARDIVRQSGVIAWRRGAEGVEIMLVSSRARHRWVIPKGSCEPGMTAAESALVEASEEAGLEGQVGRRLGVYPYVKNRLLHLVEVFELAVERELEEYLEKGERDRRWIAPSEAAGLVWEPELAQLLRSFEPADGMPGSEPVR